MSELSDEQLNKLSTQRLLTVYKKTRWHPSMYHRDDICYNDTDEEYDARVEKCQEYQNRIKVILDTRQHVPKSKKTVKPACVHKFNQGTKHNKMSDKGYIKFKCKKCGKQEYRNPNKRSRWSMWWE